MTFARRFAGAGLLRRAARSPGGVASFSAQVKSLFGANTKLVLDARLDTISLNGADVSGWADESGFGNNASQATVPDQPLWQAVNANFAGHGAVAFDRVNGESLYANGIAPIAAGLDRPFTISCVWRPTNLGAAQHVIWGFGVGGAGFRPLLHFYTFTDSKLYAVLLPDSSGTLTATSTSAITADPKVLTVVRAGATVSVYDGATVIPGMNGFAFSNGNATSVTQFAIGQSPWSIADKNYAAMELPRLVAIDRAITAGEVASLSTIMRSGCF